MLPTTRGTLLDGRVIYDQPLAGYRTGIEPVLLAASIPGQPGQRVIEAGSGAGAGLLCLLTRIPGIAGIGVEQDHGLAELARANAALNGFDQLALEELDILAPAAGLPGLELCDHAMANPPWYGPLATASPDRLRDAAKRGGSGLLHGWAESLAKRLHRGGTLTFILRAEAMTEAMAAFTKAQCGSVVVFPLWPRAGRAARLVLIRGIRGGRGGTVMHPGLVLHADGQGFTAAADRILREGGSLGF